ncbi:unnamed protein product [Cochlearia groenlandica]
MHFLATNVKHLVYAAVSLMILAGLTFVGTAIALTVLMPVLIVFSPVLVPAVITSVFLATGLLGCGSLGASAIAVFFWLYKKEERSRYNMHTLEARGKEAKSDKFWGRDKSPEKYKLAEEIKPPEREKTVEEDKLSEKDKSCDKPSEENTPIRVIKHVEEVVSLIPEIAKVLLTEQNLIGPKRNVPSNTTKRSHHHQIRLAMDSSKVRSMFMKEYQKVPRVGASAYKYFTSRDKRYKNSIRI